MGSALTRAFLNAGHQVTVWNRSPEPMTRAIELGAKTGSSPASAIASSPITVMCVSDYDAAFEILHPLEVEEAVLRGKVLVQATTGTSEEVNGQSSWLGERGATYLDAGIMCYPREIGRPGSIALYSGPKSAFFEHSDLLMSITKDQRYVGESPTHATALYLSLWGIYFSAMAGFFEGVAYVNSMDLDMNELTALLPFHLERLDEGARDAVKRIGADLYSGEQGSVEMHVDGLATVASELETAGLEALGVRAYLRHLEAAAAAGFGSEDVASIFKALNANR